MIYGIMAGCLLLACGNLLALSLRVGRLRAALDHRDAIIADRDAEIRRLRERLGFLAREDG